MVRRRRERKDEDVRTQREEVGQVMTTVSEIMKRNWQDPEFRERVKKGRDRYYKEKMKKRLVELANGKSGSSLEPASTTRTEELSDRSDSLGISKDVEYRQTDLEEFAKSS